MSGSGLQSPRVETLSFYLSLTIFPAMFTKAKRKLPRAYCQPETREIREGDGCMAHAGPGYTRELQATRTGRPNAPATRDLALHLQVEDRWETRLVGHLLRTLLWQIPKGTASAEGITRFDERDEGRGGILGGHGLFQA